jgi:general secretion pathway protein G
MKRIFSLKAGYGARRHPIVNEAWERLLASIIAAGKLLPQSRKNATSLEGFTMMEVMIGIAIILVLAGIAIPSYLKQREDFNFKKTVMDIQNISQMLDVVYYAQKAYPNTLAEVGMDKLKDRWGNAYEYWPITGDKNQKVRKDHNTHPINTDFDLCSKGKDGQTNFPLTANASRADIIRARNGAFIGLATDY